MRLVSGIKPTGGLTLGNYIGAIQQFVHLQDELKDAEFFIFIADLHAITTPIEKALLKKNIKVFHGKNLTKISKILEENISDNEILITQGAGNVADISNSLVAMYK